jgi:hypothetical protein
MRPNSNIFRSRWAALLWAAGFVLLALQFAWPDETSPTNNQQSEMTDVTGAKVDNAQVEQVEGIMANL